MASALNDNVLSSNQNINWFLMLVEINPKSLNQLLETLSVNTVKLTGTY